MIIVAALARNGVIGNRGSLPWHIPSELKWFKELTTNSVVLMGRGTWEGGIPKPLPNRENWVVTSRPIEGVQPDRVFCSLAEAYIATRQAELTKKVFLIGGGQLFTQCISITHTMYLTHVDLEPDGDVFFPEVDLSEWDNRIMKSEREPVAYEVVEYKRR